jgi:hypothetical protein
MEVSSVKVFTKLELYYGWGTVLVRVLLVEGSWTSRCARTVESIGSGTVVLLVLGGLVLWTGRLLVLGCTETRTSTGTTHTTDATGTMLY